MSIPRCRRRCRHCPPSLWSYVIISTIPPFISSVIIITQRSILHTLGLPLTRREAGFTLTHILYPFTNASVIYEIDLFMISVFAVSNDSAPQFRGLRWMRVPPTYKTTLPA